MMMKDKRKEALQSLTRFIHAPMPGESQQREVEDLEQRFESILKYDLIRCKGSLERFCRMLKTVLSRKGRGCNFSRTAAKIILVLEWVQSGEGELKSLYQYDYDWLECEIDRYLSTNDEDY